MSILQLILNLETNLPPKGVNTLRIKSDESTSNTVLNDTEHRNKCPQTMTFLLVESIS